MTLAGHVPTRAGRLPDRAWPATVGRWLLLVHPAVGQVAQSVPRPIPRCPIFGYVRKLGQNVKLLFCGYRMRCILYAFF